MPASNAVKSELRDLEAKLASARECAARPDASERDKSDLKLIEQEFLAAQNKAKRDTAPKSEEHHGDLAGKVDRKLDQALKDSFPGSDPVSFVEAAPVKKHDRALPEVKVAEQQKQAK